MAPLMASGPSVMYQTGAAKSTAVTAAAITKAVAAKGTAVAARRGATTAVTITPTTAVITVMARISAEMKNWAVRRRARAMPHQTGRHCCRTNISWRTTKMRGGMTSNPPDRWPWVTLATTKGE